MENRGQDRATRLSHGAWFMQMAIIAAQRGTCSKRTVGCVGVDIRNRIIATGYNGSPGGIAHCIDVGCLKMDNDTNCIRCVHSEINCLASADHHIYTMFITDEPCLHCVTTMLAFGVHEVYYLRSRVDPARAYFLNAHGLNRFCVNIFNTRDDVPYAITRDEGIELTTLTTMSERLR